MKAKTLLFALFLSLSAWAGETDIAEYTDESDWMMMAARQEYICSAQDPNGRRYLSSGPDAEETQEQAFRDCSSTSRAMCYRTGCILVNRARRGD